jgi:hypothetical membrane protein
MLHRYSLTKTSVVFFFAAVIILHLLKPEISPIGNFISELAIGHFGWLMATAFVILGIGSSAIAWSLWRQSRRGIADAVGAFFLALWGIGLMLAAVFTVDPMGTPPTPTGNLHNLISLIAFVSLMIGSLIASIRQRGKGLLALSASLPALFILTFGMAASGYVGLFQRIFAAAFLAWLCLATRSTLEASRKNG